MIKFVCASCEERLSVPDQHGGRKGLCPSCGAVNRIPLKGFAETQPNAPVIAREVRAPAASAQPAVMQQAGHGGISMHALSGRVEASEPLAEQSAPAATAVEESPVTSGDDVESTAPMGDSLTVESAPQPAPLPDPAPVHPDSNHSASPASLNIFGSRVPADPRPVENQIVRSASTSPQELGTSSEVYDMSAPAACPERRLPKPVKIALLVIAVLGIVGGLYCALYFGIQVLISKAGVVEAAAGRASSS